MSDSPMMCQYKGVKLKHQDALLFFRMGDFYELFNEDAILASKELEIVLTKKFAGGKNEAPMCGVPYHSAETYISKLIAKGYKVAICEQMTPPKKGKELVEREVVRIITPGTILEDSFLERGKNNFLLCVYSSEEDIAVAWTDISTGELFYSECESIIKLNELLSRLEPAEILCNAKMQLKSVNLSTVKFGTVCPFSVFDETAFELENASKCIVNNLGQEYLTNLKTSNNSAFEFDSKQGNTLNKPQNCIIAIGALLSYISYTQKQKPLHLNPCLFEGERSLYLNSSARRNLEIFQNIVDGKKKGSLLWVIDKTKTAMGARQIRKWLESPLLNVDKINERLNGVDELVCADSPVLQRLASIFDNDVKDIERICGRLCYGSISPKECYALGYSLSKINDIKDILKTLNSDIFLKLSTQIGQHSMISSLITSAVKSDAPSILRDGGFINEGFDTVLDNYLSSKKDSELIEKEAERLEKEATGIKNLKISHNKIIGYYIEVPKSAASIVPYRYQRKGSTLTCDRYTTEELRELEFKVLNANELALNREIEIFTEVLNKIKQDMPQIVQTAKALANLDCLMSFAEVSLQNNYTRPKVLNKNPLNSASDKSLDNFENLDLSNTCIKKSDNLNQIRIVEGRHPIVEKLIKEPFVPNDTYLDSDDSRIIIITGPNMAGKSIYMRQVALITIMAQIGCFVPAHQAQITIVDKIFTRIGASDDIKTGRSTFMVEMNEVSEILQNADDYSLILLDEVGRGTSTYDGLSIAWAILHCLAKTLKAKVLFSTHYHELTKLEGQYDCIKNFKLTVKENGDTIVFVRKLMRGSANKSFGIEVASIAGLPKDVIFKAKEILKKLSSVDITKQSNLTDKQNCSQLSIFASDSQNEINKILSELDVNDISPRHALDILSDLKEKALKP